MGSLIPARIRRQNKATSAENLLPQCDQNQNVKQLPRGFSFCRVDWGLPMLQADVGVLCLPPGFPVVPQYLGHTSVALQPLTEPDKQLSHIRLFALIYACSSYTDLN